MNSERIAHDAPIVTTAMFLLAVGAIPFVLYLIFAVWPESLSRQVAASGAVLCLLSLAIFRKKYEALLLATLLFSQFAVSLHSFDLAPPVKLQILFSDIIISLFVFVAIERRIRLRLDSMGLLFLLLLTWFGIAGYYSIHPHRSFVFILCQFKYLILYVLAVSMPISESLTKRIVNCILCVIIIQGFIALAQTVKGGPVGLGIVGELIPTNQNGYLMVDNFRSAGTIGGINGYAGYMSMLLVFILPFVFVRRSFLFYAGFGIGVVAIILALSRAGWLSFLVGSICVVYMMLRARLVRFSRLILLGFLGGIVLTLCVGVYYEKIVHRFVDPEAISSATSRVTQFSRAWKVISQNPVVGIGPGVTEFFGRWNNNRVYIQKYLSKLDMPNQVHNSQLQVAIESGFPGLVIFLSIMGTVFLGIFRKIREEPGVDSVKLLRVGGACATVAVMVHISFGTEYNNIQMFLVFWLLLGLARNRTIDAQEPDLKQAGRI